MYSDQQYEEAINVVKNFGQKILHEADSLKNSAQNCVSNMEGDEVAKNQADKLKDAMDEIQAIVDNDLKRIVNVMEEQRGRITELTKDND